MSNCSHNLVSNTVSLLNQVTWYLVTMMSPQVQRISVRWFSTAMLPQRIFISDGSTSSLGQLCTVMLVVDVSRSTAFGTRRAPKSQVAAEVAAMCAFSATNNDDQVGLLLMEERQGLLAVLGTEHAVARQLETHLQHAAHRCFVIDDQQGGNWLGGLLVGRERGRGLLGRGTTAAGCLQISTIGEGGCNRGHGHRSGPLG
jgi:hypothetical protein